MAATVYNELAVLWFTPQQGAGEARVEYGVTVREQRAQSHSATVHLHGIGQLNMNVSCRLQVIWWD